MDNPFDITIYDRDFGFTGRVVDPQFTNLVPSWQNQGYGNFALAANNPHTDALMEKGARLVVLYRGKRILSGPITSWQGGVAKGGAELVTYQFLDWAVLFRRVLSWVAPRNPLMPGSTSQLGQAWMRPGYSVTPGVTLHQTSYYQWAAVDSAESAIKNLVRDNMVTRLGMPITIAPDLHRGPNPTAILPEVRMEPLADSLQPIMNFSGLSVAIWQEKYGTGWHMDVVEHGQWQQALTPESGIIVDGYYGVNHPEVTRPIVGGPGDSAARAYGGIQGAGLLTPDEVDFGYPQEVFSETDGDFDFRWPDGTDDDHQVPKYYPFAVSATEADRFRAFLDQAVAKALEVDPSSRFDSDDKVPPQPAVSTLQLTLSETPTFHFGGDDGIQIGDYVTLRIRGATFTDYVTECQMVFTRDDGVKITPLIGQKQDDPDVQVAQQLAALARAYARQQTRK